MRPHEWTRTASGWWRSNHAATYSRWRKARKYRRCDECGWWTSPGNRYIETTAAPWHDASGQVVRDGRVVRVWNHMTLCGDHTAWAPPSELSA